MSRSSSVCIFWVCLAGWIVELNYTVLITCSYLGLRKSYFSSSMLRQISTFRLSCLKKQSSFSPQRCEVHDLECQTGTFIIISQEEKWSSFLWDTQGCSSRTDCAPFSSKLWKRILSARIWTHYQVSHFHGTIFKIRNHVCSSKNFAFLQ